MRGCEYSYNHVTHGHEPEFCKGLVTEVFQLGEPLQPNFFRVTWGTERKLPVGYDPA